MTLLDTLEPVGDPASSRGDHTRCLSPCMKSMKVDGIQGRCCLDGINSGARPSSWATSGAVLYAQCSCAHALTWGCFSAELEMVMSLARGTIRSGLILLNALCLPGDADLCLCTVFAQTRRGATEVFAKTIGQRQYYPPVYNQDFLFFVPVLLGGTSPYFVP